MVHYSTVFLTLPLFQETTIVEEDVSADGSVHMVDRRAKLNVDAPYLLKKMMGTRRTQQRGMM